MLGDEGGGNLVPFDQGLGPIGALLHASHCGSVQLRQLGGGEFYNGVFLQQLVLLLEEDQLALVKKGDVVTDLLQVADNVGG